MGWHIAADVGGTFTDLIAFDERGHYAVRKLPSTPDGFERAVCDGIVELLALAGASPGDVERIAHGTTAGTNAILERKGSPTLLLTTKGFRDVLEIGRLRVPNSYDLYYTKPAALVPRRLRIELNERVAADGSVLVELDEGEIDAAIHGAGDGLEAVAVSLLNSYANGVHEQRIRERLAQAFPHLYVTVGTDLVNEPGEFERASTAAVNAYLQPVLSRYLDRLSARLDAIGAGGERLIMQSSGGMMTFDAAARAPAYCIESGPAAGALAARSIAEALGLRNVISFDMGGTTAKAAVIEEYALSYGNEFSVGAEISAMGRLLRGGGYTVRLPTIDLAEVGAGGGSIARLDSGGSLRVGPRSAGAVPGPVCYARGGVHPTVTDANLVLGYLSAEGLAKGGISVDADGAMRALDTEIGVPLGLDTVEAAFAVHTVADQQMARALRAVTTERGRDIRAYTLVAFGGSGPLHAATLAASVGVDTVIVPPLAGYFSAIGLSYAPKQLSMLQPLRIALRAPGAAASIEQQYRAMLARLNGTVSGNPSAVVLRSIDMRYRGQAYELSIDAPDRLDDDAAGELARAFEKLHRATYGHVPTTELEVIRLKLTIATPPPAVALRTQLGSRFSTVRERTAHFGDGRRTYPVATRDTVAGMLAGPAFIDDPDTTIVVPPGWSARVDAMHNVVLEQAR